MLDQRIFCTFDMKSNIFSPVIPENLKSLFWKWDDQKINCKNRVSIGLNRLKNILLWPSLICRYFWSLIKMCFLLVKAASSTSVFNGETGGQAWILKALAEEAVVKASWEEYLECTPWRLARHIVLENSVTSR